MDNDVIKGNNSNFSTEDVKVHFTIMVQFIPSVCAYYVFIIYFCISNTNISLTT